MFRRLKKFGQKAARKIGGQGNEIRIEEIIFKLSRLDQPWSKEAEQILDIINELGNYENQQHVINTVSGFLVKHDFLDVFVRIWDHCHTTDVEEENYLNCQAYITANSICCNYSDSSLDFCKAAYSHQTVVRRFMKVFTLPEMAVDQMTDDTITGHLSLSLIFLHNIVRLYNNNRYLIRENDGVHTIAKYRDSASDEIKATAMFIMAYCINDDETDKIMAGHQDIKYMINKLASAVGSENHRDENSFSAQELVMGLNKMALNDANKLSIVKSGILPRLHRMLGIEFSVEEQRSASECLYTLSFHEKNRATIVKEPNLLVAVRRLIKDSNADKQSKASCEAILFNIEERIQVQPTAATPKSSAPRIMISYQWDVQDRIVELQAKLQESGYNVWLDIDSTDDSMLAAMADAIQNASVVLVAVTENYKNSNPCRTEAEYAFKLRKPIVPLRLEQDYHPDGWLGALLGMKLYVDLWREDWIQSELPKLLRTIQANTNQKAVKETVTVVDSAPPSNEEPSLVDFLTKPAVADQNKNDVGNSPDNKPPQVAGWSKLEVAVWADATGVTGLPKILSTYDGIKLNQLQNLLRKSPDSYYKNVRADLQMNLDQTMGLADALDKL